MTSLITCRVPWPVCPNCIFGDVVPSGDGLRCRSCAHAWAGRPLGAPCGREGTHVIVDDSAQAIVCAAHAELAHRWIPGAQVQKLAIERKVIFL